MKEQGKDIQITLTKEFHTTYWKTKINMVYYALICLVASLVILMAGIIFDAIPTGSLRSGAVFVFGYLFLLGGALAVGIHLGIGEVGKQISKRIHEEHPELFVEQEKKDV